MNESDLFKTSHDLIELRWGFQNVAPRKLEVPLQLTSLLPMVSQK